MKFNLFFLIIIFLLKLSNAFGMEKNDDHSVLEKKIYVDENKNVFINYKAPLYLRLSTSPDESAPSVLWYNEGTKDRSQAPKPMDFKTPGKHHVGHFHSNRKMIDPSTNFNLYLDSRGPFISYDYSDVPEYFDGHDLYMGEPVTLTLKIEDKLSGVKKTFISINESPYQEYLKPISFDKEKSYDLTTYSIDNVGNRSHDKNINFIVDLTAPETSYFIQGLRVKDNFSDGVTVGFKSTDDVSKVKSIFYEIISEKYNRKGFYRKNPLTFKKLPDGAYKIFYYGLDHVLNKEEPKKIEFYLDKTPPVFGASIEGDQFQGKKLYVSHRSKIKLTAEDAKVPVKKIIWKYKNGVYKSYGKSFSLPKVLGEHEISYKAVDQLNNWTRKKKLKVVLDLLPPFVEQKFEGPYIPVFEKIFVSKNTRIIFDAKDIGSGVKEIRYKINDDAEKVYDSSFKLEKEGTYNFNFHSIDNVNNEQTMNKSKIVVDNTPPEIFHHFSNTGFGKVKKGEDELTVYFPGSRLFLAASDKKSGTKSISYKLRGSLKTYKGPLELWRKGLYEVDVFSKDRVGNSSMKSFSFIIGNKI